jgi:hypothetical protein
MANKCTTKFNMKTQYSFHVSHMILTMTATVTIKYLQIGF